MADGCKFAFKRWVPEAAKSELQRLAEEPGANYRLLQHLASHEVMREVWEKLPKAARGKECLLIRQAYAVALIAQAWQKLEYFRKKSSLQNAKKAARSASKLLDAMKQTGGDAVALSSLVEQVTMFYALQTSSTKGSWRRAPS